MILLEFYFCQREIFAGGPYGLDFISWLGDWRAAAGEIQVERDAGRKSVAG